VEPKKVGELTAIFAENPVTSADLSGHGSPRCRGDPRDTDGRTDGGHHIARIAVVEGWMKLHPLAINVKSARAAGLRGDIAPNFTREMLTGSG